MDELVVAVGEAELLAACSNVAFFVVPAAKNALLFLEICEVAQKSEDSDVELPAVHKEWILDVPLQDAGLVLLRSIVELVQEALFDLLQVVQYLDAMASIGLFSGLDDPPAVLGERRRERLELFMLQYIASFHFLWQVYDVRLRHDRLWRLLQYFGGISIHIPVQLALGGNLIDAINMVVDLVMQ